MNELLTAFPMPTARPSIVRSQYAADTRQRKRPLGYEALVCPYCYQMILRAYEGLLTLLLPDDRLLSHLRLARRLGRLLVGEVRRKGALRKLAEDVCRVQSVGGLLEGLNEA